MTGLTLHELIERTRVERGVLADVLADELRRGHVIRRGDTYRLSAGFDSRYGPVLRAMGDRDGENDHPAPLRARVLDEIGRYRDGRRVVEVAQSLRLPRHDVRAELHRLMEAGIVVRRDGMNKARVYSLASPAEQAA